MYVFTCSFDLDDASKFFVEQSASGVLTSVNFSYHLAWKGLSICFSCHLCLTLRHYFDVLGHLFGPLAAEWHV